MRAGPSGEERGTPHYTVPIYPQCPQEIGLLALPVFQGAAVSSEYFSQFLLPGNVAELRGLPPPLWGSLEQPPINGVIPGGSRAGSGNGTRSEHSPEEGGHRDGPSSRQRVRVL